MFSFGNDSMENEDIWKIHEKMILFCFIKKWKRNGWCLLLARVTCSTRKIRNKKIQDVHELQLDDRWWMPDQCTHNNPSRLTMAFHLKQQQKNEWQAVFIYKLLTWYACVLFQWIAVLLATRMVRRHTRVLHLLWKTSHVNVHSCEGLLERTVFYIKDIKYNKLRKGVLLGWGGWPVQIAFTGIELE